MYLRPFQAAVVEVAYRNSSQHKPFSTFTKSIIARSRNTFLLISGNGLIRLSLIGCNGIVLIMLIEEL